MKIYNDSYVNSKKLECIANAGNQRSSDFCSIIYYCKQCTYNRYCNIAI